MDLGQPEALSAAGRAAIARALAPGEALLWAGEPVRLMRGARGLIWLVAAPFVLFALTWFGWTLAPLVRGVPWAQAKPGVVMALLAVPVLLLGWRALTRPLRMLAAIEQSAYALTPARLLRVTHSRGAHAEVPHARIARVELTQFPDDIGSLTLHGRDEARLAIHEIPPIRGAARLHALIEGRA